MEDLRFQLELMDNKLSIVIILLSGQGNSSPRMEIVNHDTINLENAAPPLISYHGEKV